MAIRTHGIRCRNPATLNIPCAHSSHYSPKLIFSLPPWKTATVDVLSHDSARCPFPANNRAAAVDNSRSSIANPAGQSRAYYQVGMTLCHSKQNCCHHRCCCSCESIRFLPFPRSRQHHHSHPRLSQPTLTRLRRCFLTKIGYQNPQRCMIHKKTKKN